MQLPTFKNLKELMKYLSDEEVCRNYVEAMRWPDGNIICPFCNGSKAYRYKDGKTFRCREKTCRKDFSLTAGTIFENTKIKLQIWLAALYVLASHKKGISSHQLAGDLGITQKTAWFVLQRLRLIMGDNEPEPLNNIVEVDETYVGGKYRMMNRKRRTTFNKDDWSSNKTAVMGFLQRDGKARLRVIGAHSLLDMVRHHVHEDALIVTDSHIGYKFVGDHFSGHAVVNHQEGQYRNDLAYTNSVEGFFSLFKRTIYGTYHSVSPKHLHRYCAESTLRFNTRKVRDAERFSHLLTQTKGRLKYNELIGKNP